MRAGVRERLEALEGRRGVAAGGGDRGDRQEDTQKETIFFSLHGPSLGLSCAPEASIPRIVLQLSPLHLPWQDSFGAALNGCLVCVLFYANLQAAYGGGWSSPRLSFSRGPMGSST